jgi:hypothetical protein
MRFVVENLVVESTVLVKIPSLDMYNINESLSSVFGHIYYVRVNCHCSSHSSILTPNTKLCRYSRMDSPFIHLLRNAGSFAVSQSKRSTTGILLFHTGLLTLSIKDCSCLPRLVYSPNYQALYQSNPQCFSYSLLVIFAFCKQWKQTLQTFKANLANHISQ